MPDDTNDAASSGDLPAVFWDEMPSDKDNADLAAINALIDEQTPEERAESYKVRICWSMSPMTYQCRCKVPRLTY